MRALQCGKGFWAMSRQTVAASPYAIMPQHSPRPVVFPSQIIGSDSDEQEHTEFIADGFDDLGVLFSAFAEGLVGYVEAWRRRSMVP